jgi:hypothetical protein
MPISTKTSGPFSLTRPPKNDEELGGLVEALWGVRIPRHKVCDEHDAPMDWFASAFFRRQPSNISKGSRGLSGKSYAMSALGLTTAVVLGGDVNLLGGSFEQSANIHKHMRNAWNHPGSPRYMLLKEANTEVLLSNHSIIRPLTASQKTVRGPHPATLLLDELDEMDYEIYESSLGQPMNQQNWAGVTITPVIAGTSTLQYGDGTFSKIIKKNAEEGIHTFEWCYHEAANPIDGWLTQDQILHKKQTVSAERWRVEYELGEPGIGNRAFDSNAVERTFAQKVPEGALIARKKDYEEYEFEKHSMTEDYVIAADWARSQDYTVISVWKATSLPMQLVYYVRMNHLPWPVMIKKFNVLQQRYRAEGIHDATGLGDVVASMIEDTNTWDFKMVGAQRDDMLSEYVGAVEQGKVRAHRIESIYKATLYASVEDLFSRAKEFHLPDEVCSAALAWRVVSDRFPGVLPIGLPKTDNNWMAKAVEHNTEQLTVKSTWNPQGLVTVQDTEPLSAWDAL